MSYQRHNLKKLRCISKLELQFDDLIPTEVYKKLVMNIVRRLDDNIYTAIIKRLCDGEHDANGSTSHIINGLIQLVTGDSTALDNHWLAHCIITTMESDDPVSEKIEVIRELVKLREYSDSEVSNKFTKDIRNLVSNARLRDRDVNSIIMEQIEIYKLDIHDEEQEEYDDR